MAREVAHDAVFQRVDQPFLEARVAQLDGTAHEALGDSELIERVLLAQDTLERGARRRFRVYFLPGFLHTFVLSRLVRLALGREQAPAALARLLGGLDHHMDRLALALAEVARQALALRIERVGLDLAFGGHLVEDALRHAFRQAQLLDAGELDN